MNTSRNVFSRAAVFQYGEAEEATEAPKMFIVDDNLNDRTEAVVQSVMDWRQAILHEGKNLTADERTTIADRLEASLKQHYPDIQTNADVFYEYGQLIEQSANLNSWYVLARDIVQAHIHADLLKSQAPVTKVLRNIQARNAYIERHDLGHAAIDATHHIAKMLENGDALGNADRVTAAQTAKVNASAPAFKRT